jgi:hypothetical protein
VKAELRAMDSKDRKYQQQVQKVLIGYDSLEEWPDYIAFLNKLQKTIQSHHRTTTNHWIPHDLDIAIILSKCLSPNLPSGVHQKALEIYQLIFKELGIDTLSSKVNIWIPGVLPIIQYASISIKPLVIQLYKDFLLTLPSTVLKPLIKPILSYLLCSIDDERSEFFDVSLELIDKFKTELNDDSLFWQSIFIIIITSDEKRLGALVWCNKRLPDLNVVLDDNDEDIKSELKNQLSAEKFSLIDPEPGLLIRAFISSLNSDNVLIQRGFFDLLIKNLYLSSTVLQKLASRNDLRNLIISVVNTILKKDMSLNRRVWNWLLGNDLESNAVHQEYFQKYGAELLTSSLLALINGEYYDHFIKHPYEQKVSSFKICLAIMDKWEIGSIVIPKILLPFLKSIKSSQGKDQFEEVLKSGMVLFDSIETLVIFQNLVNELLNDSNSEELLNFVLTNFKLNDEEMIIHQLPLLLIALLIKNTKTERWYTLVKLVLELIPKRAFLPIEHSTLTAYDKSGVLDKITSYYNGNEDILNLPFQPADLSHLVLNLSKELVVNSTYDDDNDANKILIFDTITDLIPEYELRNEDVLDIMSHRNFTNPLLIIQLVKLFNKFKFATPVVQLKVLKKLIHELCSILHQKTFKFQIEVVKSIQSLTLQNDVHYVEAGISTYLLSLDNFNKRLEIFNYLWIHSTDMKFLTRPLFIILDDLNNSVTKLIISKWILNCCYTGLSDRLFQILTLKIYENLNDFELFQYYSSLLFHVLSIDDAQIMKLFSEQLIVINSIEFQDLNGYTFKDFTVWVISRFMAENSKDSDFFNPKILNSIFTLLEFMLNYGKIEINEFTLHLLEIFEISNEFISNPSNSQEGDYDLVSIVLINHLTDLIRLSNDKNNNIESVILMKTSEDESGKSLLIEFLLSSFRTFNKPELLSTLLNLLNNLLMFQNELIFQYVDLISITIIDKINSLYGDDNNSKDDLSISLLLTNLNEVLSLLRTYVVTLEINDSSGPGMTNSSVSGHHGNNAGFFTSVVSNVFSSDAKGSSRGSANINSKSSQFRNVLNHCLSQSIITCFKIWSNSDLILKKDQNDEDFYDGYLSLKYQSIKLKHKSKQLFESLFELEPTEILKTLVLINNDEIAETGLINNDDTNVFKLLHALDGTRPQLTMPKIFKLFNSVGTTRPNGLDVISFLIAYTKTLQDDSIEDIFQMTISFLKEVNLQDNQLILLNILKFISVFSLKLSRCKFGSERQVKKEINDLFVKLLPLSLNSKQTNELVLASSVNINDKADSSPLKEDQISNSDSSTTVDHQEEVYKLITFIVPHIRHTVQDVDKQSSVVSSILVTFITGDFKSSKFPNDIKESQLELLKTILVHFPNVKSLKFLITETFNDLNFFKIKFSNLPSWNLIIKNWLNLNNVDNNAAGSAANEKLLELLNKSTQFTSSSAVNLFNWKDNEQNLTKLLNLRKISYILLISNNDQHIVLLKGVFNKLDELITQQSQASAGIELSSLLNSEIFLMLRVIVMKFSPMNLINYWTFIYTSLQRFFVNLLSGLTDTQGDEDALKLNIDTVLQACKLLDVLLVLKCEDFQEWIFIIDTINAIFKNHEIISLIDQISAIEFTKGEKELTDSVDLISKISEFKGLKKPALLGVKKVESINSLKSFFNGLSYYNYENIYNGVAIDRESCIEDIFHDLFV